MSERRSLPRRRFLAAATTTGVAGAALAGTAGAGLNTAAAATGSRASAHAVWRKAGDDGRALVRGRRSGALRGRTVAVKDLFAVAGERIGGGNPYWLAEAPVERRHSAAVERLLEAGADVTGLAVTDELAYSLAGINIHYGTPHNPAAPGRVAGGSSSGPASAVAQRLADIGLGTDTGGSVRVPASNCGLYGIRTTHGLVSRQGLLPLAQSFDTVGWLTRDAATLHKVAGQMLRTPPVPAPRRLLIANDLFAEAADETARVVRAAALELAERRGLQVVELDGTFAGELTAWSTAFRIVQSWEGWANHGDWITAHPGVLASEVASRFAGGAAVTAAQLAEGRRTVATARERVRALIPAGTVLALPAAAAPAVSIGATPAEVDAVRGATLRLTCAAGVAGLPCVVAPGPRAGGLPVGLGLVGAAGSDLALTGLLA
ncbi:amidase [Spirillospora sp. NPDC047279]|uniref:amidase n=1 Tax=Spirillospora sp. NPDC047279 TaxID=3155478 RepID=UPI0033EF1C7D